MDLGKVRVSLIQFMFERRSKEGTAVFFEMLWKEGPLIKMHLRGIRGKMFFNRRIIQVKVESEM